MESVDTSEVLSNGGRHKICIGVTWEDADNPKYEHSVVWNFQPTFQTDSQNPMLVIETIVHKRYWEEVDVDTTDFSNPDGCEIINSFGWNTYTPEYIPQSVQDKFTELFGKELADGTFSLDMGSYSEPGYDVTIPDTHTVIVPEITLSVSGSYTEDLDKDDPRVGGGHYTNHLKDAETGEILHTAHQMEHEVKYWIQPDTSTDNPSLKIQKCFHKTWDDKMSGGFTEEFDGEYLIESYETHDESPAFSTIPDDIIGVFSEWLGEPIIAQSVEQSGGEMPIEVYYCFDCNTLSEVTPRETCPCCESESLCCYESVEQFEEIRDNQTEEEQNLIKTLVDSEPTVSTKEP